MRAHIVDGAVCLTADTDVTLELIDEFLPFAIIGQHIFRTAVRPEPLYLRVYPFLHCGYDDRCSPVIATTDRQSPHESILNDVHVFTDETTFPDVASPQLLIRHACSMSAVMTFLMSLSLMDMGSIS